jgi:hypothetical protein
MAAAMFQVTQTITNSKVSSMDGPPRMAIWENVQVSVANDPNRTNVHELTTQVQQQPDSTLIVVYLFSNFSSLQINWAFTKTTCELYEFQNAT